MKYSNYPVVSKRLLWLQTKAEILLQSDHVWFEKLSCIVTNIGCSFLGTKVLISLQLMPRSWQIEHITTKITYICCGFIDSINQINYNIVKTLQPYCLNNDKVASQSNSINSNPTMGYDNNPCRKKTLNGPIKICFFSICIRFLKCCG